MIIDFDPQTMQVMEQVAKQQGQSLQDFVRMSAYEKALQSFAPQKIERPFNFDIDELDRAIKGKFVEVPKGLAKDPEAFEKWLDGAFV